MRDEMVTNAASPIVNAIGAANANPNTQILANLAFAALVHPFSYWDHKPDLTAMLGLNQGKGTRDYYFPIEGDAAHEFYYDVWSNIHFGYVGAAAGFDLDTLLSGAGVSGIAGRNDAYDDVSVRIGFLLWQQTGGDPSQLTAEMIRDMILGYADEYQRIWREVYGRPPNDPGVVIDVGEGNGV
jgi:hypothetical protein